MNVDTGEWAALNEKARQLEASLNFALDVMDKHMTEQHPDAVADLMRAKMRLIKGGRQ